MKEKVVVMKESEGSKKSLGRNEKIKKNKKGR